MTFGATGSASAVLEHRYLYGPADQVLADEVFTDNNSKRITDELLWLISDHQGTVRDVFVLNEYDATLRKHVEYDSFGDVTEEDWFAEDGSAIADPTTHAEAVDQLFYHTGQERDGETGLQKQGARWYDPAIGRWLDWHYRRLLFASALLGGSPCSRSASTRATPTSIATSAAASERSVVAALSTQRTLQDQCLVKRCRSVENHPGTS